MLLSHYMYIENGYNNNKQLYATGFACFTHKCSTIF